MAKKKDKKQCWCKGCCNNWCETYEFYGIKNYTWNKCWDNVRNNGILSQYNFEATMVKKAFKSGKLSYTRFVGETLVWLAVVLGIVCLFGKFICWIF
tara:strand:- start:529 stop:819 length:291 start_codon:yes stop_codon:yes gene_type:complete